MEAVSFLNVCTNEAVEVFIGSRPPIRESFGETAFELQRLVDLGVICKLLAIIRVDRFDQQSDTLQPSDDRRTSNVTRLLRGFG